MSEEPFRTIFEPFRIHSVEPMRLTTAGGADGRSGRRRVHLFELRVGVPDPPVAVPSLVRGRVGAQLRMAAGQRVPTGGDQPQRDHRGHKYCQHRLTR
jgi:hypothetical protein